MFGLIVVVDNDFVSRCEVPSSECCDDSEAPSIRYVCGIVRDSVRDLDFHSLPAARFCTNFVPK